MSDLFDSVQPPSFKSKLQSSVQRLAASNIFVGTSAWKSGLVEVERSVR